MHLIKMRQVMFDRNGHSCKFFAFAGRAEYKDHHKDRLTLKVTVGRTIVSVDVNGRDFGRVSEGGMPIELVRSTEGSPLEENIVGILLAGEQFIESL